MAQPSIEIAWGGGKWNKGHRRATRPYLQTAIEIAQDGLEDLGICGYQDKAVIAWQAVRGWDQYGESHDAAGFEVHIPYKLIRYRKLAGFVTTLTEVVFHELVHSVRYEAQADRNLLDLTVSEGLAYVAGMEFAEKFLLPGETGYDVFDRGVPNPEVFEALRDQVSVMSAHAEQYPDHYDAHHEQLLDNDECMPGVDFGIWCIEAHLRSGRELGELIWQPTEELVTIPQLAEA